MPAPRLVRRAAIAILAGAALVAPPGSLGQSHAVPRHLVKQAVHPMGSLYEALSTCRRSLTEEKRWEIAEAIDREARRHGYDPLFVQAMVEVESTCSPTAKSRRGAMGLIQVRPATARAVAEDAGLPWKGAHALFEPGYNVRVGLHYLNQLEERFGDPITAIAAYNMGPTRASRLGKTSFAKNRYVKSILSRYEKLLSAKLADEEAI